MKLTPSILLSSFVLLALPAARLGATTFVMVSDEDLVDRASAVVEARVLSVEPAPGARPATDFLIEIETVLKGSLPGSNLVVRVPGGMRADGIGLKIWGAPEFREGDRALLFLDPGSDGTFRVRNLVLGAFHVGTVGGRSVVVRDLSEARELPAPGEPVEARARYHRPRDRARFAAWIADRALGQPRPEDYFVSAPAGGMTNVAEGFSFLTTGNNQKLRWRAFDNGDDVGWRVHMGGQPPFTLAETVNAFRAGQGAWNNDAATNVDYRYAGNTSATGGLTDFDGINAIVFGDPSNDIDEDFDCSSGGVLATGGPWFSNGTHVRDGETFRSILGADIVTNADIECFFTTSPNRTRAAEELFGHELGHTLGLGHSCDDPGLPCDQGALMYDFIHDDGRGAQLRNDDRSGIFYLYGSGAPPAAPSSLQGEAVSETEVHLTWQDNSTDETMFRVQQRLPGGIFSVVQSLPANSTEATVGGLAAATTYEFRIRADNAFGSSTSNVASVTTSSLLPAVPGGLTAEPASSTSIALSWTDNSDNETGFVVERSSPLNDYQEVALTGPGATSHVVGLLTPGLPSTFRVRARNATGDSAPSNEASATPAAGNPSTCTPAADTLCLLGRFQVRVQWRNQHLPGDHGLGTAEPFPGPTKSGTFWFFNPANVELIVKALDASTVNGRFWVFYGALSDVEYWITVTDTETGGAKTYHNPPDNLCGVPDTDAFPAGVPLAAGAAVPPAMTAAPAARWAAWPAAAGAGAVASGPGTAPCVPDSTTLCLENGRFELRVSWIDERTATSGVGRAVPGTDKTGYFWFFNSQNIELVTKVLDARTLPGNSFWFFYGALSDVHYTIIVRDTVTGLAKPYTNEQGDFCGLADTVGFPDSL